VSHTYIEMAVHLVFSAKERRKLISKTMQPRMWAYLAGICKKQRMFVHEIGGMDDHVHMLIQLPSALSLADAVLSIKIGSSQWMGKDFEWQRGFGAFAVSASNVAAVVRYIRNQEAHHKKMSFEEEFITLLKKHGVKYDPRYVFG
jgi:putative transposase